MYIKNEVSVEKLLFKYRCSVISSRNLYIIKRSNIIHFVNKYYRIISLYNLLTMSYLWNGFQKTNEYSSLGKIYINHWLTKVWNTGNWTQSTKLANSDWWTSSFNRDFNPSITPFQDNRVNYEHNVKSLSLFCDDRNNGATLP